MESAEQTDSKVLMPVTSFLSFFGNLLLRNNFLKGRARDGDSDGINGLGKTLQIAKRSKRLADRPAESVWLERFLSLTLKRIN
ncbi:hypothetical protein B0X71_16310 [Planococcus lenghuensis]|uniref:Uncharacterized protein n=1 Tax=Planococcus lenghuensis TaxID=2213202 RepID=A0A1Q2L223_9BACL|nr:hypothetical protein B0X71_16310 [Planococcus lenghuensis]